MVFAKSQIASSSQLKSSSLLGVKWKGKRGFFCDFKGRDLTDVQVSILTSEKLDHSSTYKENIAASQL